MFLESFPSFFTSVFLSSRLSLSHSDLVVVSRIAIFFGGKAAVSALTLQPLYGRAWHGWYNAPGCHAIVWELVRTLLQSSDSERRSLFLGIDGKKGPKYIASRSGTVMEHTGHIAYMLMNSNWRGLEDWVNFRATLMQLIIVDLKTRVRTGDDMPRLKISLHSSLHIIAITASIAACVICASVEDWLSFTMILLGMVSSGTTSFIMRTGKITLERPKSADGAPPGDGMLLSSTRIIILKGEEEDVNAVTKGKLQLKLEGGRYTILLCAFIALSQVTLQLVFMPFGSLPGQLTFLLSLLVSVACNIYISAKADDVELGALLVLLKYPRVEMYKTNVPASAAVLACLALYWETGTPPPKQVLEVLVPIKIRPWKAWSEFLVENIKMMHLHFMYGDNELTADLDIQERKLLWDLVDKAHAMYGRYIQDYLYIN
ncbi:hypothetical protein EDB19DRAFT_1239308 [Suillus lakei]|nr:hypothetical protein EDB19DRAFT_1239308 [Suillus lakei]